MELLGETADSGLRGYFVRRFTDLRNQKSAVLYGCIGSYEFVFVLKEQQQNHSPLQATQDHAIDKVALGKEEEKDHG